MAAEALTVFRKTFTDGSARQFAEVLRAFDGRGVVRVLESSPDSVLMEHLGCGARTRACRVETRLDASRFNDEEATEILIDVILAMSPQWIPPGIPRIEDWGTSFDTYLASENREIPKPLVEAAREKFLRLAESQKERRLLHGDLHHGNILFDEHRGWLAIDPKGVIGELEYELGAPLRNPLRSPHMFEIDRRIAQFAARLPIDAERTRDWAFAQTVLATIWLVEDGQPVPTNHPWLRLSNLLQQRT